MRENKTVEVITCDFCGNETEKSIDVKIDETKYDICPECSKRLNIVVGYKHYKDDYLSLNMNQNVTICLADEAVKAYNNYMRPYGGDKHPVVVGEWKTMQLHHFLSSCSDSFKTMRASLQKIALPFEIRMKIKDLSFEAKENTTNNRSKF